MVSLTMAPITVGIDTNRVYNRKVPPGGEVSDVFSFKENPSQPVERNPKKIDRYKYEVSDRVTSNQTY